MISSNFSFLNSDDNSSNIFEEVAQIITLIDESKTYIQDKEYANTDMYMKPIIKLEQLFKRINLHSNWDTFKKNLDPGTMTALQFSSDMLSRESNEQVLNDEEINDLLEQINNFQESLFESNIDGFLKKILTEKSEILRVSIINYKIHGIDGLRRAVEMGLGSIIVNEEQIKMNNNSIPYWEKLFKIILKVNTIVSLFNNSSKFIEGVTKLLPSVTSQ